MSRKNKFDSFAYWLGSIIIALLMMAFLGVFFRLLIEAWKFGFNLI